MKRPSKTAIGLTALFLTGIVLRVTVVMLLTTEHAAPLTYEHGRIAENMLEGRGFSIRFLGGEGATSQQAPFYPFLLAGVYSVAGIESPASILFVQLLQCVVGAALIPIVYWLARSLMPGRPAVAWVAACAAMIHPTHLYMTTHLQVVLWVAVVFTLLLALVVSPRYRATWRGAIYGGLLSGLLLLIDPILALVLPIIALAFWSYEGGEKSRLIERFRRGPILRAATMAGVALLVVTPWLIRGWVVHGQPVFIKSSLGYAFWQANHPISHGTDKIPKETVDEILRSHDGTLASIDRALWEARHETVYIDNLALTETDYCHLAALSEPERSKELGRRAMTFIADDPGRYVRLCFDRLQYFLLIDRTNPKASHPLYQATTYLWFGACVLGLLVTVGQWRRLWPTYALFAIVTIFHSLVITSVRFRIPLEPMTLVWAASAVVFLARVAASPVRAIRRRRERAEPERPVVAQDLRPHFETARDEKIDSQKLRDAG